MQTNRFLLIVITAAAGAIVPKYLLLNPACVVCMQFALARACKSSFE